MESALKKTSLGQDSREEIVLASKTVKVWNDELEKLKELQREYKSFEKKYEDVFLDLEKNQD